MISSQLLRLRLAALAGLVLSACSAAPANPPTALVDAPQAKLAAASTGAWTTYHHDNAHTGYDNTQPTAFGATTGWVSPTLDGSVYAEPLVFNGFVYAATLQGTVYALNQSDGTTAWSRNVGAPQSVLSGQCGNVNPLGILSTPVIDTAAGRIYVSEILAADSRWHVFGIDLTSHLVVLDTPIVTNIGTGFDWTIEQQRGALALANGYVYVPFGGRIGDCGPYHGWVIGVPTNGSTSLAVYETPSMAEGIWAPGGVAVDDSTGNVFFATGNAIPCAGSVNSDSVIRTAPTLGAATSFFQPQDWSAHWCGPDLDMGSVTPVLISPSLMFTTGKYGQGFLMNPANLGGTNGQLYPSGSPYVGVDVCVGDRSNASFGSIAYANGRLYLPCEQSGVVSLTVNTSTPSFSSCDSSCTAAGTWHTSGVGTLGAPIVAGGVVWAVSTSGGGLWGFDANTGGQVFHSANFSANRFSTPSEAGGQIFVGAGSAIRSFNLVTGCSSVTLSAAPPSPAVAGTTVVLTATASGASCVSPQYQWWWRTASGPWTMLQDYGASNTYNWTATSTPGDYFLGVHVRALASTAPYESLAGIPFTLTPTVCTAVSLSAAPASPSIASTSITVTATATCPNANPQLKFVALWAGTSTWITQQAYSTTSTWTWNSTGAPAGIERFGVWVKDAGSPNAYDRLASIPYTVTNQACTGVTLTAAPPSPSASGTTITVTATATCPNSNPKIQFVALWAGTSSWIVQQAYSTTTTWTWNSTGAPPGIERFGVWVKDASAANSTQADIYYSIPYQVT